MKTSAERQCPFEGGTRHLKKGSGGLCATAAVKYAWMQQQHAQFKVSRMGQLLEVSRSGYYEWLSRPPVPKRTLIRRCKTKYSGIVPKGVAPTARAVSSICWHKTDCG